MFGLECNDKIYNLIQFSDKKTISLIIFYAYSNMVNKKEIITAN